MSIPDLKEILPPFISKESFSGILLMAAAALAMLLANSPLDALYYSLLDTPVEVRIGELEIAKPLLLWINDGLMAVFFFLIGLELKRELVEGELSDPRNIILPGVGALGGMLVPALIYVYFNYDDPRALQGWAIPAATDIAFALGVLSLLGSRVPTSIKVFLTSLAIFDDVGAIIIIAVFYTANISVTALLIAGACLPVAYLLNRYDVIEKSPYMLIGIIMWVATLKSGVHATLAGVILAMFVPLTSAKKPDFSPLKDLEHDLHSIVAFFVLPVFAFANAGISFGNMGAEQSLHGVTLGIAFGLFFGKQIGVFGLCALAIKTGITKLPKGMNYTSLYATAALCGIGFTMSLFIGSLAFSEPLSNRVFDERIGIVAGSLLSGVIGFLLLRYSLNKKPKPNS
ncbi:MAG: NhaA family Na+:H+ antiporter [Pseudohongiellaceae bacterium]|jgi:NhaA family Na+:H+ antiporter